MDIETGNYNFYFKMVKSRSVTSVTKFDDLEYIHYKVRKSWKNRVG